MSKFKVGDRVRVKGVGPDSPMFDTGTIVGFTFGSAKVHWETADEIYTGNASELEPLDVSARRLRSTSPLLLHRPAPRRARKHVRDVNHVTSVQGNQHHDTICR